MLTSCRHHIQTFFLLASVGGVVMLAGCTTYRESNTARTPEEQILLSKAVEHSLAQLKFESVDNRTVFLDTSGLDCVDKPFVADALRHAVSRHGAQVQDKAETADTLVTVRAGMLATQLGTGLLGIPSFKIPLPMTGTVETPEIALFKRTRQDGMSKLDVAVYDKADRKLTESCTGTGRTQFSRWTFLLMGHFETTNVPELQMPASPSIP